MLTERVVQDRLVRCGSRLGVAKEYVEERAVSLGHGLSGWSVSRPGFEWAACAGCGGVAVVTGSGQPLSSVDSRLRRRCPDAA